MEELFKKTADFKYSSLKYLNLEEFQTILPEDLFNMAFVQKVGLH